MGGNGLVRFAEKQAALISFPQYLTASTYRTTGVNLLRTLPAVISKRASSVGEMVTGTLHFDQYPPTERNSRNSLFMKALGSNIGRGRLYRYRDFRSRS
jgi:hypothetical protein